MALVPGTRLGPYDILTLIGSGGMGEVYRARDTKLNRDVAIKVLLPAVASDPDRLARFSREAQVLASLNHPNIAHIHGLEESDGVRALVMELVEGPTLADRIAQRPIPLDEVLPIAKQIAEALEAAHEQGIIHRDLKPANIKIKSDGTVKVLDFGLAKSLDPQGASSASATMSPTLSIHATEAGVILGTAAYMSPEQARGKIVDKRTDIWAFGCVLYEMLTGTRAFSAETVSDTVAAVLTRDPDWSALPREVPASMRLLLRLCLRKDAQHRLRDIGDAFNEESEAPVPAQHVSPRYRPSSWGWIAAGLLLTLALIATTVWRLSIADESQWSGDVLGGSFIAIGPRVSPDGQIVAFQAMEDGQTQVAVMKPASGDWTVLTHDRSHGQIQELCWSRDGTKIYFDRVLDMPGGVFSVPVVGGDARLLLEDAIDPQPLPDGSLLVVRFNRDRRYQLHRFWPDTGHLQPLGAFWIPNAEIPLVRAFPDGREAVFFGKPLVSPAGATPSLYVIDLVSGRTRQLASQIPSGAAGFPGGLAVTADGRHVLVESPTGSLHRVLAIPRDGRGPVRTLFTTTNAIGYMDAGTDGNVYLDQIDRTSEVLRFPPSGGVPEHLAAVAGSAWLTTDGAGALALPDGRIVMASNFGGRARLFVTGPGKLVPLLDTPEETRFPAALVGIRELAFLAGRPPDQTIAVISLDGGRIVRRLRGAKNANIQSLSASADGGTLYYAADGNVWTIPASDGEPRKIHSGDGVAVDPRTQDLIVQFFDASGARLARVPLSGAPERTISVKSDLRLALSPLVGRAVGNDGRILVQATAKDSWFWVSALVSPATGNLERIGLTYAGDALAPGWADDGRIVAIGMALRSTIWRFRHIQSASAIP